MYFRELFSNKWIYLYEEFGNSKQFIKTVIFGQPHNKINVLLFCFTGFSHGCETSSLTVKEEEKLSVFDSDC
jgi:hypothetical protein